MKRELSDDILSAGILRSMLRAAGPGRLIGALRDPWAWGLLLAGGIGLCMEPPGRAPATADLLFAAFAEEAAFRMILQDAAEELIGRRRGKDTQYERKLTEGAGCADGRGGCPSVTGRASASGDAPEVEEPAGPDSAAEGPPVGRKHAYEAPSLLACLMHGAVPPTAANIAVSALFALAHAFTQAPVMTALTFIPSIGLGILWSRHRSLWLCAGMHAWFNFLFWS